MSPFPQANSQAGSNLRASPTRYPHLALVVLRRSSALSSGSKEHRGNQKHAHRKRSFGLGERHQVRLGKLPSAWDLTADFSGLIEREGFQLLAISGEHGIRAGLLPGPHKNPFDRILIAQAQAENIPIISNETSFDSYGVRRLW